MVTKEMTADKAAAKERRQTGRRGSDGAKKTAPAQISPDDIRHLSLAMSELAASLHELATTVQKNPQFADLPEAMRELSKRVSVLSTRL